MDLLLWRRHDSKTSGNVRHHFSTIMVFYSTATIIINTFYCQPLYLTLHLDSHTLQSFEEGILGFSVSYYCSSKQWFIRFTSTCFNRALSYLFYNNIINSSFGILLLCAGKPKGFSYIGSVEGRIGSDFSSCVSKCNCLWSVYEGSLHDWSDGYV